MIDEPTMKSVYRGLEVCKLAGHCLIGDDDSSYPSKGSFAGKYE